MRETDGERKRETERDRDNTIVELILAKLVHTFSALGGQTDAFKQPVPKQMQYRIGTNAHLH